jgi:tricorn protease-like protein
MKEIGVLRGGIIKGVAALKFSPNGSKLACACIDDNHMVVVFDVDKKEMIACEKGDTAKIVDLDWMGENEFATVGVKHYKTWNLSGSTLTSKKGTFGK